MKYHFNDPSPGSPGTPPEKMGEGGEKPEKASPTSLPPTPHYNGVWEGGGGQGRGASFLVDLFLCGHNIQNALGMKPQSIFNQKQMKDNLKWLRRI